MSGRKRTVILFLDETILTETPPLRKGWAHIGKQALVPIAGNRSKRIMYGALNIKTGNLILHDSLKWNQYEFQPFLTMIRQAWRGWNIVLFLDHGTPHKAPGTLKFAKNLGIKFRWLPKACPKLNPMDHLWRHIKNDVLPNEAISIENTVKIAYDYLQSLSHKDVLRKAGALSDKFWFREYCPKI